MCDSACHVAARPSPTSFIAHERQPRLQASHAKRSHIRTPCAAAGARGLPISKLIGALTHQHGEGADAEIIAHGTADHQKAGYGYNDANRLRARRHFAEHDRSKAIVNRA